MSFLSYTCTIVVPAVQLCEAHLLLHKCQCQADVKAAVKRPKCAGPLIGNIMLRKKILLNIVSSSSEKRRVLHCDLGNYIFFQILSNKISFHQVSLVMKIKKEKEEVFHSKRRGRSLVLQKVRGVWVKKGHSL
jgi:hypothetical protein